MFIGQPGAAGAGLNLQIARYGIRFSRSYIPEDYEQTLGRNNRAMSPHESTTMFEVVTEDTKDEELGEYLVARKDLSSLITLDWVKERRGA